MELSSVKTSGLTRGRDRYEPERVSDVHESAGSVGRGLGSDRVGRPDPGPPGRREFIKSGIGVAGFAASAAVLAACGGDGEGGSGDSSVGDASLEAAAERTPEIEWEMATSWPASLVTIFGSAQFFARKVSDLTGGRFKINPRPAGEIVGGLQVLPTVRDLGVDAGHTASYYYVGLSEVQQFGTAVPFGLTQRQQNAWLYHGGGLQALNEFYAEEYGIIAFPAANSGCQMGGWFTKEIDAPEDLRGLKMRIPGLAGRVLESLGGEQVTLPGGEILTAIQTGAVDGAEFAGPTDDLVLGLDQLKGDLYYYHPGWWEPGASIEVQISLERWNELPFEYQSAVETAAMAANLNTVADYDARNQADLKKIKKFAEIREFSPSLMAAFRAATEELLDDIAAGDEQFAAILGPWREFRDGIAEWHGLAELSYLTQQSAV